MKVLYYGMHEHQHFARSESEVLFVPKMGALFFKYFLSWPGADEENDDKIRKNSAIFHYGNGLSYGFERSRSRLT